MKMDRFNNASQYSTPGEKKQNETETNLLQRLSSYMYNLVLVISATCPEAVLTVCY